MAELVTLAEVKLALRIDNDDEDTNISLLIKAASGAVIRYLKSAAEAFVGENGAVDFDAMPDEVRSATILLVGRLYKDPDGDPDKDFQHGYLPMPVVSLLYPLRDPAVA